MKLSDDHREQRPHHHQRPRPPAIRQRAEGQLRDRVRHLEAHRDDARRLQRQVEMRDQQRQQRRVDVRIRIDDHVRRGDLPDRRVQPEPAAVRHPTILLHAPDDEIARFAELADAEQLRGAGQHRERDADAHAQPHDLLDERRRRATGPSMQHVGAPGRGRHHQRRDDRRERRSRRCARPRCRESRAATATTAPRRSRAP